MWSFVVVVVVFVECYFGGIVVVVDYFVCGCLWFGLGGDCFFDCGVVLGGVWCGWVCCLWLGVCVLLDWCGECGFCGWCVV